MKAKITKVSEVDSSGNLEIAYDIYDEKTLVAKGRTYQGQPEFMEQQIKVKLADLKNSRELAIAIKVGQEIIL